MTKKFFILIILVLSFTTYIKFFTQNSIRPIANIAHADDDDRKTPRSVNVAPVQKVVPAAFPVAPIVAPVAAPQVINQVSQTTPSTQPSSIEKTTESIPNDEEIANQINNLKQFEGSINNIELKEVSKGILEGQIITTQKILGLFEVNVPYEINYDVNKQELVKKPLNNIWQSFIDFISF